MALYIQVLFKPVLTQSTKGNIITLKTKQIELFFLMHFLSNQIYMSIKFQVNALFIYSKTSLKAATQK